MESGYWAWRSRPLSPKAVRHAWLLDHQLPERVIGLPVPVLDERTEMIWWDTANYFFSPGARLFKRAELTPGTEHWWIAAGGRLVW